MRHPVHDYTSGAGYFITFNTKDRRNILGRIENGKMYLSAEGRIVEKHWRNLPQHYPRVFLDAFCIMPDHVHALIFMSDARFRRPELPIDCPENRLSLSEVIRALKSFSALEINRLHGRSGSSVWQRGYMERVIRGESELEKFRGYILTNPQRTALREDGKSP